MAGESPDLGLGKGSSGMVSKTVRTMQTAPAEPDLPLRPARLEDCRRIAELFRISSDGIADYIWSTLQDDYPGQAPIEIGRQRYARENTAFSYQNCVVAERDGAVVALLHAFAITASDGARAADDVDPVLRPYAELEAPGSLYISALAVMPEWRGQGLGSRLLDAARERARTLGCPALSLICFAENSGARRLYQRQGFTVVDRRAVVPHPMIHATCEALLMSAPVP
ncbi:MAG: acetyltransferase [Geminicoccaceae bacterium]|nr:acetyltransferase [Geminicoccaceae bacterium]